MLHLHTLFLHVSAEEISADGQHIQIIDGIKEQQRGIRYMIEALENELKAVAEIGSMQEDLDAATARKDKAYESLAELRQVRDKQSVSFLRNRMALNKARDCASRGMVAQLQGLHKTKVDEFMSQWCHSKAFREDYDARIHSSLNVQEQD